MLFVTIRHAELQVWESDIRGLIASAYVVVREPTIYKRKHARVVGTQQPEYESVCINQKIYVRCRLGNQDTKKTRNRCRKNENS